MKKTKWFVLAVFISLIAMSNASRANVVANIDNTGQLTGFQGIVFSGFSWDVQFKKGSAFQTFENGSSLDFHDSNQAQVASQALLTTYQLPAYNIYNLNPELTFGVTDVNMGSIFTPWFMDVNVAGGVTFNNWHEPLGDFINIFQASIHDDLSSNPFAVYADWNQVSAVPVPTAIWLMSSGLLGLIGFSRKNKA